MITIFRKFKLWSLKTKWELALWIYFDKQAMDVIQNPEDVKEKIEKKLLPYLAELIHSEAKNAK